MNYVYIHLFTALVQEITCTIYTGIHAIYIVGAVDTPERPACCSNENCLSCVSHVAASFFNVVVPLIKNKPVAGLQ